VPVPETFSVFDRPNDDGSELLVTWPRPASVPPGAKFVYVVEIAKSPDDFLSGKFDTEEVEPSRKALASSNPECFGRRGENDRLYYVAVSPSDHLLGPPPRGLSPQRLEDFAAQGVIDSQILARAKAALALSKKPPAYQPTEAEKDEMKWLGRLTAYLKAQDQKIQKARRRQVNGETCCFRLAVRVGAKEPYRMSYVSRDGRPMVLAAQASPSWFKWTWTNNLVLSLLFCATVLVFIQAAKRRPSMFIRKIAGLEAVDEAIGRSTEMDRPVFFVHGGSSDVGDLATIASLNILARVARRTAEHDSRIRVMNNEPIVTAVSQEIVQQAYKEAGRPDAYNPDDVSLVASDQFSYVAAVSGLMVREQPGAIFLLGSFFAESLLLAETGASTGAIQVAGTDQWTQLPFFITTCDYTLIGEELYAASAYLSREPRMLGSLRGQDVGKAFMMVAMIAVSLALTVAAWWTARGHSVDLTWLRDLLRGANG
jgi:hypothetical protein